MDLRAVEEEAKEEIRQGQKKLTLFMLGSVDVGKTYTVTSIATRFYEQGLKVAVVDADVGQSDIGPPCCIGMGILEKEIQELSEVPPHSLFFVGNTSPNGCVRECVQGAVAAVKKAKELSADVIIVDSTGWIEGEDAKRFKLLEIEEINPSFIVVIERDDELEHILLHLTNKKIIKLRISGEARSRTREERRALREKSYNKYFRAAKNKVIKLSLLDKIPEEGTLLGLFEDKSKSEREIAGLGILRKLDYEQGEAVVFTPVDTEAKIKRIKTGRVKLIRANGGFKEVYKLSYFSTNRPGLQPDNHPKLHTPSTCTHHIFSYTCK
jgi:polynucleotide 5'-kinase involved in rRNA processing